MSNLYTDPILRLYTRKLLKAAVINQYHKNNGHMGVDKTYDAIKHKYYCPNIYKELYNYVISCVTCHTRIVQKPPLKETDIPPYAFAKVGIYASCPYPTTLSNNMYSVGFIDLYNICSTG